MEWKLDRVGVETDGHVIIQNDEDIFFDHEVPKSVDV